MHVIGRIGWRLQSSRPRCSLLTPAWSATTATLASWVACLSVRLNLPFHAAVALLTLSNSPNQPRQRTHTVDPDKERSILGKGAFGTVYTMVNPHDHQVYAVKELTNLTLEDGSTDETAMHELLAEVRKMGVVESEFIVQYRTSAVFGGRFYVMMEPIASWGSLSQLVSLRA